MRAERRLFDIIFQAVCATNKYVWVSALYSQVLVSVGKVTNDGFTNRISHLQLLLAECKMSYSNRNSMRYFLKKVAFVVAFSNIFSLEKT